MDSTSKENSHSLCQYHITRIHVSTSMGLESLVYPLVVVMPTSSPWLGQQMVKIWYRTRSQLTIPRSRSKTRNGIHTLTRWSATTCGRTLVVLLTTPLPIASFANFSSKSLGPGECYPTCCVNSPTTRLQFLTVQRVGCVHDAPSYLTVQF